MGGAVVWCKVRRIIALVEAQLLKAEIVEDLRQVGFAGGAVRIEQ